MRCLNEICIEGDARYRQVVASYYYGEIAERGAGPVLKEMALIAMNLASLSPVTEEAESDSEMVYAFRGESKPRSLFDREVAAVERMIRGRRKSAGLVHDEWTEWLNDLEANGATVHELDDAFRHVEALDQYDEGGAIVRMSAHERTFACGRVDHEFTADDLPDHARFLAGALYRAYTSGVEIAPPPKPAAVPRISKIVPGDALTKVMPIYPPMAKQTKASGGVQVAIVIGENGRVIEAKAISGHPALRPAAEEAARKWIFRPASIDGKPIRQQDVMTFNFNPPQ
jgi:TonB family protein